jgi:Alr-MurF fusion protein
MPLPKSGTLVFQDLPQITGGKLVQSAFQGFVVDIMTDSRKAVLGPNTVFFAIAGTNHDGHAFIADLAKRGCQQFVVERPIDIDQCPGCNVLLVTSAIQALQQIAAHHRQQFQYPVIGITGSNGKTVVKEWLHQLLSPDFTIIKNPGSYNSQLGVPLSVWAMDYHHTLGIFEAGISKPNEMEALAAIIQPTVGLFTNLLAAHDEGFASRQAKAAEKAKLFKNATVVVYCKDHVLVDEALKKYPSATRQLFSWGYSPDAQVRVQDVAAGFRITYQGDSFEIQQVMPDAASRENLLHAVAMMLYWRYAPSVIQARLVGLRTLPMRLEMKEGVRGSTVIDDSYSFDLAGLKISLDFLNAQNKSHKVVVLSDLLESGLQPTDWIARAQTMIQHAHVDFLIGIGKALATHAQLLTVNHAVFSTVEECLAAWHTLPIADAAVLIKGARVFRLERIAQKLQKKIHGTVLEVDLNAVVHNLNMFRAQLNPQTKIMAMVKAFAYGSGTHEVATLLQYHKVDYMGVAYADEGQALRKHGIHVPIMVMNPTPETMDILLESNLEPSIYSLPLLHALCHHLQGRALSIHIKFDTGMHRLGFEEGDLPALLGILQQHPNIHISSVYSHLAGSDEAIHDGFSAQQVERFVKMYHALSTTLNIKPIRHILNSAGISRLGQYQMDMVRLGIGLYGVDPGLAMSQSLQPAVTLRTTISQIKTVAAGETIGYGRHGKAEHPMQLATLAIGYADGYSRKFSKGVGKVWVNGQLAPVVGNVCMDMTMIDVTQCQAQEGGTVEIFGSNLSVSAVADWIGTIPYELLTSTSDRVKRVFFAAGV